MAEIYLSDPDLTLWHGDALSALSQMEPESVDCVVTSPPYWGLRDYGEEGQIGLEENSDHYVEKLVKVFQGVACVLADHGTVWLNLGDSYAKKGLVGIPWRVAFALQEDGWHLRSDIIWAKPNPMPESITDRPTKSHEYIFMLSKKSRYFFDQEAVREPAEWNRWGTQTTPKYEGTKTASGWMTTKTKEELNRGRKSYPAGQTTGNTLDGHVEGTSGGMPVNPAGRNIRTVWNIATQPYADAHFATFPLELPRRAISAGCPTQVCTECGEPRTRIVEREVAPPEIRKKDSTTLEASDAQDFRIHDFSGQRYQDWLEAHPPETVGWTDCGHDSYRTGVVLDPFFGSGTTALAARSLERNSVGIEINEDYCKLAARRLQQLSLLSDVAEA